MQLKSEGEGWREGEREGGGREWAEKTELKIGQQVLCRCQQLIRFDKKIMQQKYEARESERKKERGEVTNIQLQWGK